VRLFNRRQRLSLIVALAAFILIGLFPPWRYLNGQFAGMHFVASPPPALPDSALGNPRPEYTEIKMIPLAMYNMDRRGDFSREELRRPYLDARRLLGLGAIVFLGLAIAIIAFNDRRPAPVEAAPLHEAQTRNTIKDTESRS